MDHFVVCSHCFCEEPHTKIYRCSSCKTYFCNKCKESMNKCPHCGVEVGPYEVKGEIGNGLNNKLVGTPKEATF